jgi:8-oxo-dGTP pyrophosphatase MutT (NUDIX family)
MATTAVFAELVAIGVLAATFLVVLVLGLFPKLTIPVTTVNDLGNLATFVAVSLAYVLGAVVDRLADTTYKALRCSGFGKRWIVCRFGSPRSQPLAVPVSTMRLAVMGPDDGKAKFLDYQRSRLRIARAAVLALVGLLLASSLLVIRRHHGFVTLAYVDLLLLAGLVASVFAAERIGDAYVKRLAEAYWITVDDDPPRPTERRAAAVCHRGRGQALRFLLVKTKGGHPADRERWTFPKGHIEAGEEPYEAAEREAREEAGACGKARKEALTTYRFPKGKGTVDVEAHLLKVSRPLWLRPKEERERERTWCSPQEAIAMLAEGREGDSAAEHARVIGEAVGALGAERAGGRQ